MTRPRYAILLSILVCASAFNSAFGQSACSDAQEALKTAQEGFADQVKQDGAIAQENIDNKCSDDYLGVLDRRAERSQVETPLINDFIEACQDDPGYGTNARNMKGAMKLFGDPADDANKGHADCNK